MPLTGWKPLKWLYNESNNGVGKHNLAELGPQWRPEQPKMTAAEAGKQWWAFIPNDRTRPEQKVDKLQACQSLRGLDPGGCARARPAYRGALDWKIAHDCLRPQAFGWLSGDPACFEMENWVTSRCLGNTWKLYLPIPVWAKCVCCSCVSA